MPFFSVIIPTYNRYKLLKQAINSVLEQTFSDYELIVVDDGSNDDTPSIEEEYGNKIIFIRQNNSGVSSARNRGIKKSRSPYIAFLDSDDLWLRDKLIEQKKFISENPDFLIHQSEEIWIRRGKRVNPMKKHEKKEGNIFFESLELCMVSPSSVVIKKDLFDKYGLFDEQMPACEDYDLWLRIGLKERVGLIRKNLIVKRGGHEDQLSKKYPIMDSFRLYSILKLLRERSVEIKEMGGDYYKKTIEAALNICSIIYKGALKRKRTLLAGEIEKIIKCLSDENCSIKDFSSLLRI